MATALYFNVMCDVTVLGHVDMGHMELRFPSSHPPLTLYKICNTATA